MSPHKPDGCNQEGNTNINSPKVSKPYNHNYGSSHTINTKLIPKYPNLITITVDLPIP